LAKRTCPDVALAGQMAAAAAWAAAKGALPHRLHARARLVGRAPLATHAKRCPSPMAGERRAWIKETAQAQGVSAMRLVLNSSHPAPLPAPAALATTRARDPRRNGALPAM